MYEVEVKVRADHEDAAAALAAAGATERGTVVQRDTYYDAPDRDFAKTDEALRVRKESGDGEARTLLTYKGPLVEAESKTREEHETAVADEAELRRIVEGLGCEPAATVEKERQRWSLDGYTVTLDSVSGLGEFVEVETEVTESEVESAREGARNLLRELGLDPTAHVRTSYLGLLLDASEE